jgi:hypothetical protein
VQGTPDGFSFGDGAAAPGWPTANGMTQTARSKQKRALNKMRLIAGLIRSFPSQSPDKSGVMGELCRIIRHLGSENQIDAAMILARADFVKAL